MECVEVDGVRLEVQRLAQPAGRRKAPIVFLHEGLGSAAMWRDWPARVCQAAGRAGIVYSRRGYGRSDPIHDVRGAGRLRADYMHREAMDVLPALLDQLNVERPVLVGHSDGGSIALIHAAHFDVPACCVMAPHVMVEQLSIDAIEMARDAYESSGLRERLQRFHADVDSAFWQWNDVWLSREFRSFDIRPDCRRIRAPVLAIQGRDDAYGSLRQIEEIAPTSGEFTPLVLDDCGHSPHRDQPEATTDAIVRFLAQSP